MQPNKNDFSRFTGMLYPHLLELEKMRKQGIITLILTKILYFLVPFLLSFASRHRIIELPPGQILLLIILGLILMRVLDKLIPREMFIRNNIRNYYKTTIVEPMVSLFSPDYEYAANESVSLSSFIESGIFLYVPEKYSGDDFVFGKLNETYFTFSEISAERLVSGKASLRTSNTAFKPVFKGIFANIERKSNVFDRVLIIPKYSNYFDEVSQGLFQKQDQTRTIFPVVGNRDFEKLYNVYAHDALEVQNFVTPELMAYLLHLYDELHTKVNISFTKRSTFFALEFKDPLFEPFYFKTVIDKNHILKNFSIFSTTFSLIDFLTKNSHQKTT